MGWTPEEIRAYLRAYDVALSLLEQLASEGFKYKAVDHFRFCPYPGTAAWKGLDEDKGHITIYLGCQPGAIGHELGHSFHERLRRDRNLEDKFGEDFAEAFRWFTEQKLGPSTWCTSFKAKKKDDAVLVACGYDWGTFVERLKKAQYYPP